MNAKDNEPTAGCPHIRSPESQGLLGNMVHLKVNRCSGWVCIQVRTYVCSCLVNDKQFLGGAILFEEFQGKPIICLSPLDASCFPRWVTSSYRPPDDVMSSNCIDVAAGPGAEERRKKKEKEKKGRGGR